MQWCILFSLFVAGMGMHIVLPYDVVLVKFNPPSPAPAQDTSITSMVTSFHSASECTLACSKEYLHAKFDTGGCFCRGKITPDYSETLPGVGNVPLVRMKGHNVNNVVEFGESITYGDTNPSCNNDLCHNNGAPFNVIVGVPDNTVLAARASDVQGLVYGATKSCAAGQFPVQQDTCADCPAGKFSPSYSKDYCMDCPPGKYQAKDGMSYCNEMESCADKVDGNAVVFSHAGQTAENCRVSAATAWTNATVGTKQIKITVKNGDRLKFLADGLYGNDKYITPSELGQDVAEMANWNTDAAFGLSGRGRLNAAASDGNLFVLRVSKYQVSDDTQIATLGSDIIVSVKVDEDGNIYLKIGNDDYAECTQPRSRALFIIHTQDNPVRVFAKQASGWKGCIEFTATSTATTMTAAGQFAEVTTLSTTKPILLWAELDAIVDEVTQNDKDAPAFYRDTRLPYVKAETVTFELSVPSHVTYIVVHGREQPSLTFKASSDALTVVGKPYCTSVDTLYTRCVYVTNTASKINTITMAADNTAHVDEVQVFVPDYSAHGVHMTNNAGSDIDVVARPGALLYRSPVELSQCSSPVARVIGRQETNTRDGCATSCYTLGYRAFTAPDVGVTVPAVGDFGCHCCRRLATLFRDYDAIKSPNIRWLELNAIDTGNAYAPHECPPGTSGNACTNCATGHFSDGFDSRECKPCAKYVDGIATEVDWQYNSANRQYRISPNDPWQDVCPVGYTSEMTLAECQAYRATSNSLFTTPMASCSGNNNACSGENVFPFTQPTTGAVRPSDCWVHTYPATHSVHFNTASSNNINEIWTLLGHDRIVCKLTYGNVGTTGFYMDSCKGCTSNPTVTLTPQYHPISLGQECGTRTCGTGKEYRASRRECVECEPGRYNNADGENCKMCEHGKYQAHGGGTECTLASNLENGQYMLSDDDTSDCTAISLVPAAEDRTRYDHTCLFCSPGKFAQASEWSFTCKDCPRGKFQAQFGHVNYCDKCYAGQYSRSASEECQTCPAGMYNGQAEQSSCKACPPGKVPDNTQAECTEPAACNANQYRTAANKCENHKCPADAGFSLIDGAAAKYERTTCEGLENVTQVPLDVTKKVKYCTDTLGPKCDAAIYVFDGVQVCACCRRTNSAKLPIIVPHLTHLVYSFCDHTPLHDSKCATAAKKNDLFTNQAGVSGGLCNTCNNGYGIHLEEGIPLPVPTPAPQQ